jgi:nitroreductase
MVDRPEISLYDAIHSTRAMRYLKPDPIPEDVIRDILDAAIRGPSGGNSQGWGWLVITDAETKETIAGWYREGWERAYGQRRDDIVAEGSDSPLGRTNYLSAEHLANHLEEAPVWIMPVLRGVRNRPNPRAGSSIYGAVQNLMLAARAHGIGATLTTLYLGHEDEVNELLGIPEDASTMALIPLGYLARGKWSQPRRKPVEEVTHWERWGEQRA